ncbi:Hypothetical predicted protein [Octopus vulgaris]|uniref:Thyroglobulin type-1 domain-containing protein n=1 Tax=Octopus vulgaris TaxID=6645 RepID=A0AA36FDF2_OCTVU|nr:Hypothetical predicted protein [Octopus vulgaris]
MFLALALLILYHTLETVHTNECLRLRAAGLNSHLINIFIPKCEEDGTYTAVQCHSNGCYCADEFGAPITDVDISLEEVKRTNMNCNNFIFPRDRKTRCCCLHQRTLTTRTLGMDFPP